MRDNLTITLKNNRCILEKKNNQSLTKQEDQYVLILWQMKISFIFF